MLSIDLWNWLRSLELIVCSWFRWSSQAQSTGGMQGSAAGAGFPGAAMTHPQQGVVSNTAMYTAGAVNPYSVDTGLYYKQGARFRAMHGASDFAPENNVFSNEQLRKAAGKAGLGYESRFAQQMPSAFGPGVGMMGGPGMMGPGAEQMMMMQQQQQMWAGQQAMGGAAAPSDLTQEGTGAGMLPSAYSKNQRAKMAKIVASERAAAARPAAKPAAKTAGVSK